MLEKQQNCVHQWLLGCLNGQCLGMANMFDQLVDKVLNDKER